MTQKEQIEKEIADRQSWLEIIEADERREVIQANYGGIFRDRQSGMNFDFERIEYRIKPKPREIWVNEYETGMSDRVHQSEDRAKSYGRGTEFRAVKFVEVIE